MTSDARANQNWFISKEGQVLGPYTAHEIELLAKEPGKAAFTIWGRGLSGWLSLGDWRSHLLTTNSPSRGACTNRFALKLHGNVAGPYTTDELVVKLKSLGNACNEVLLRGEGSEEWLDLWCFPHLTSGLNLAAGEKPTPLIGVVEASEDGRVSVARALEIQEAGITVAGFSTKLAPGEAVSLKITSMFLSQPLMVTAKLVYRTEEGIACFNFEGMHSESRAAVVDYLSRYRAVRSNVQRGLRS